MKKEKLEKIFLGRSIVSLDDENEILRLDNNIEIRFACLDKGCGNYCINMTCSNYNNTIDKVVLSYEQDFEEKYDEYDDESERINCCINLYSKDKKIATIEATGWNNATVYLVLNNKDAILLFGYAEKKDLTEIFAQ